jgi:hypothetical protein
MKHITFVLIAIFLSQGSFAQFPNFINQDFKTFYLATTEETKSYREFLNCTDSINIWRADMYDSLLKQCQKNYLDTIKHLNRLPYDFRMEAARVRAIRLYEDSIAFCHEASGYFRAINKFTGNPNPINYFIPIKGTSYGYNYAKFFYNGTTDTSSSNIGFLSNTVFQTDLSKTVVSTDLVAGIMRFTLVKWYISTSILLNNDSSSASEKTSDKVAYGGAFNFGGIYPLFFANTKYLTFYIPLSAKFSLSQSKIGGEVPISDMMYFGSASLSCYLSIASDEGKKYAFYANAKLSYIDGGERFYDNLQTDSRQGFGFIQATAGIDIKGKYRIAANFPIYSSNATVFANEKITVGIQIAPALLTAKKD